MKTKLLSLLTIILFSIQTNAQNFQWVSSYGAAEAVPSDIAKDASGNIYTTGYYDSPTAKRMFVRKDAPNGTNIWTKLFISVPSAGYVEGTSLGLDSSGNVLISGIFDGTVDFDPSSATANQTSFGINGFVLKLTTLGSYDFVKVFKAITSAGKLMSNDLVVSTTNEIYITGLFSGTADFDPSATINNVSADGNGDDIYVQKLDVNGNFVWVKRMGSYNLHDAGISIDLDASNNVYTTGYFVENVDFDPGAGTYILSSNTNVRNTFIQKLDTNGNFIWARATTGITRVEPVSIAVNSIGDVHVTGYLDGTTDFNPSAATVNLTTTNRTQYVYKLDALGDFAWAKQVDSGSGQALGTGISVDNVDNVYTTGYFSLTADFDPSGGTYNLTSNGSFDAFVQKIDLNGNFSWATSMGSSVHNAAGRAIMVDGNDVFTAGNYAGSVDFDPGVGVYNLNSAVTTVFIQKLTNVALPKRVIYVDKDAIGSNDGTSWADAFTNLTDALLTTPNNDIWVADGNYTPHASDRNVSFLINNGSEIYGGFNGTETSLSQRDFNTNKTILSGDLLGNDTGAVDFNLADKNDNTLHVVNVASDNVILDGITIINGYASITSHKNGAAILKQNGVNTLTIKNCNIKDNVSFISGNVNVNFTGNGNLTIENTIFNNNLANHGAALYSFTLAGSTTTASITNCLFENNTTKDNGSDLGYAGSAMWLRAFQTGSTYTANITNCTIANNKDITTRTGLTVATVGLSKANGVMNATIANTILYGNINNGGGFTTAIGEVSSSAPTSISVFNSIGEDNFSNINAANLTNTTSATPLFTNQVTNDFTLATGSPAYNAGNNTKIPSGITTDLLGNQRIFNSTVDIGCYEYGAPFLGIADNVLLEDFRLYPNPVLNVLNIQLEESLEKIEVYSIQGQKVLEKNTSTINVSNLSSGMYLLKVYTQDGKIGVKRFVKE